MMIFTAALRVNILTFLGFIAVTPEGVSGNPVVSACFSELKVTAPQQMEALSGSCLQIPCSFTNKRFDPTRPAFGIWLKNEAFGFTFPEYVLFNSSGRFNKYSMTMIGKLGEKNCTTLISNVITSYSHTYYFRIMNWPVRATANCNPININITDSPWKPEINISGDLKEENSVTITCSAPTPCPQSPPQLTWNLQPDPPSLTEENQDGTLTTKIQNNIILSETHDGFNITCSVSYPVDGGQRFKTASRIVTLDVKYGPKNTSVSISPGSGLVSAGNWVNLTCSSRAKPPISSFSWFKISEHGDVKVSGGDFYSFDVTADTDGGSFYCVAANELGNQTSPVVFLTVESKGSQDWNIIIGGSIGAVLLICLVVGLCIFTHQKKKKTRNSSMQLGQTGKAPGVENLAKNTQEEEETIHYGEIDFSKRKTELSSDRKQQESTVYAEVAAFQTENSSKQADEALEGLYAQVKKS